MHLGKVQALAVRQRRFFLRVLHVIPAIASRYGGPSFAIRALCKAQSHLDGMEPEIATTDADGPNGRIHAEEVSDLCPVHLFPKTWSERWKYSRHLGRWLRANVSRFDIVHIHAVWSYSTRAAANAALQCKVPYIVRPAGMLSEWSFSHRSLMKSLFWRFGERECLVHATGFHATSEQEAEEIRRLIPGSHVSVIQNGVSEDAWQSETDIKQVRSQLGIPDDGAPVILFLSRLHPKKGVIDLLLPAFASLSVPARLVIAGGADEHAPEYAQEVNRSIERLNLKDRVIVTGAIPPDRRWSLLDAADVFILPSHSENFGIVVAEAMARGRAVIVTDAVQSFVHVQASQGGIVVPVTVEAVRDALERILRDPQQRQTMGDAGRKYAKSHFRWDSIGQRVQEMYRAAINQYQSR